jgi:hypothetical protein
MKQGDTWCEFDSVDERKAAAQGAGLDEAQNVPIRP